MASKCLSLKFALQTFLSNAVFHFVAKQRKKFNRKLTLPHKLFMGVFMKRIINCGFIVIMCLFFSSCTFLASLMETNDIDRAEYEDETHFYLYFTKNDSEGLPGRNALIVAKNSSDAAEGIESHKVVKIERHWSDISMSRYKCEVSPKFEIGETVYVTVRRNGINDDIGGAGQFVVP